MSEAVAVPKPMLKELYEHFSKIEEILSTLEELMDKKGLERIRKSLEEYKKGEYVTAKTPEEIRKVLSNAQPLAQSLPLSRR